MTQEKFDRRFGLNSYKLQDLPDHTSEKHMRLLHSIARMKAQRFNTKTIPPFIKILN